MVTAGTPALCRSGRWMAIVKFSANRRSNWGWPKFRRHNRSHKLTSLIGLARVFTLYIICPTGQATSVLVLSDVYYSVGRTVFQKNMPTKNFKDTLANNEDLYHRTCISQKKSRLDDGDGSAIHLEKIEIKTQKLPEGKRKRWRPKPTRRSREKTTGLEVLEDKCS